MTRGFTLAETVVVVGLFSLLTALLFAGLGQSAKAWETASQRGAIVSRAQELARRLDRTLESANPASVEIQDSPAILSFAGTKGVTGTVDADRVRVTSSETLALQRYIVCYWTESSRQLRMSEYSIGEASPAFSVASQLSSVDLGSGLQSLDHYAQNGRMITDGVSKFSSKLEGRVVTVFCTLTAPNASSGEFQFSVLLRN